MTAYSETAEELVERIVALIPNNVDILAMDDPWRLFKIKGFDCRDLDPSLFQASWALQEAKRRYKAKFKERT